MEYSQSSMQPGGPSEGETNKQIEAENDLEYRRRIAKVINTLRETRRHGRIIKPAVAAVFEATKLQGHSEITEKTWSSHMEGLMSAPRKGGGSLVWLARMENLEKNPQEPSDTWGLMNLALWFSTITHKDDSYVQFYPKGKIAELLLSEIEKQIELNAQ